MGKVIDMFHNSGNSFSGSLAKHVSLKFVGTRHAVSEGARHCAPANNNMDLAREPLSDAIGKFARIYIVGARCRVPEDARHCAPIENTTDLPIEPLSGAIGK